LIQSTSKNLSNLVSGDHGFFGLILAALQAVTEVTKLPLSDIPCKGVVWPGPQPRVATGQLHLPKFSKTCLVLWYNNKLQTFFPPPGNIS